MDRTRYLQLAQRASWRRGHHRSPQWQPGERVRWNGATYVPEAYLMKFDGNGGCIHTARLIDGEGRAVECRLEEVGEETDATV